MCHPSDRGFSLVELLTVIAMISVLAGVVFIDPRSSQENAELKNTAQEVIAYVREARTNSITVRSLEVSGVERFPSYGIEFTQPDQVRIYADCTPDDNGSGRIAYNTLDQDDFAPDPDSCGTAALDDELIFDTTLRYGMTFSEIRIVYPIGVGGGSTNEVTVSDVSILYLRPEPTVWITFEDGGSTRVVGNGEIILTLESPAGETREVVLNSNNLAFQRTP